MKRLLLTLTVVITLLSQSHGCINHHQPESRAFIEGKDAYTRITTPTTVHSWDTIRNELAEKLEKTRDVETLNDLAVAMIHTGSTAEAIPLLEEIERTLPGLYQTATNLGTAYELLGRPADALTWIEKGIAINPNSHGGSEWIHVAVLKAKLALEKDPEWLETHRVLGMDFGDGSFPKEPEAFPTGNRGERLNAEQVHAALEQQLRERLQFVSPPDEIVAQLLFDYASLTVIKAKATDAGLPLFHFARDYAATAASSAAITKRLIGEPATLWEKRKEWGFSLAALGFVLLGSFRDVRQATKRQQPGAPDERYVSFPPMLSILLGLIAFLWIRFIQSMPLSEGAFAGALVVLAAACVCLVILSRKGERQRRRTEADAGFTYQAFSISTSVFVLTWIWVSYASIMN